jgi:hypothetical protein
VAKFSNSFFMTLLGVVAALSDFLFVAAFRDFEKRGAVFTSCRLGGGCSTNLEVLVASGAIGLITTLVFVAAIIVIWHKNDA